MAVSCCSALATLCSGLAISLPDSSAYNTTLTSYSSLQESSLQPSCIITPSTSHEVAAAVQVLVSNPACEQTQFAIKCRTHAPAAGFANIDDGVTIDMTGLSTVSINDDYSVATVGAGASWLDVYAYLDPYGRSVAGGRNGQVGVGGLTLGGGISYFSPQVGFTCDTVVDFEVVLASGELVHANSKSYADLYKALQGGTNNFGIVTSFEFNTVNISQILGGGLVNDISERGAVFQAFANIAGAEEYDVHASIVVGLLFNSTSQEYILSSTPIYTLPDLRPQVYEELFTVPNISNTLHLTSLHVFANETATPPLNWQFWTGTYGVSGELLDKVFDIVNETIYDFDVPEGVLWDLAFEPLPTVFTAHGENTDSLGTSPADGNSMILLVSVLWPGSGVNARVHAKAAELLGKINAAAETMGLKKDFVYANYADWSQRPLLSYGESNVQFLQGTADKYDPDGVFQRKVPGGFKIPVKR